ncbi:helix-turn-helix domain-containing protein [Terrilactibacillus laevilacticus]|uniref:Helix-turn-helix domain-containing protein n=1 Tax=Terrilactibacillus laevilacticus TaxID=1380157 RepID=A0ABW5PQP9_9BACI|nr:helix-turn-helix domain-containing protein [Terrilactibacillus laevilacticus]
MEIIKKIYGQDVIEIDIHVHNPEAYIWFQDKKSHKRFGIKKERVSENEYQLLQLTFSPYNMASSSQITFEQLSWSNYIFHNKKNTYIAEKLSIYPSVSLIHYHFDHLLEGKDDFKAAIKAFLGHQIVSIVWKTETDGVILLNSQELETPSEIVDNIASDLFADIKIMVTPLIKTDLLYEKYAQQSQLFNLAMNQKPEQKFFHFYHTFALALLHFSESTIVKTLFDDICLAISTLDQEVIHSVKVFLHHGFNMTTASKTLFIHRNSLSYRLQRFFDVTQLDPRNFQDAVTISLCLDYLTGAKIKNEQK